MTIPPHLTFLLRKRVPWKNICYLRVFVQLIAAKNAAFFCTTYCSAAARPTLHLLFHLPAKE
jgi:hypothetical protein